MIATVTPTELVTDPVAEITPLAVPEPAATYPTRWRFTVTQFERMGETGILHEDDRVELIEGEIIAMCAINSPHLGCVNRLNSLLMRQANEQMTVSIQNPVRLSRRSEPQPDVTVLHWRADGYGSAMPTAADVLLLIEVSDSTLAYDRQVKLPLYAQADIAEVWIVNLNDNMVEIHTDPRGSTYQQKRTIRVGESITPTLLPDLTLVVADILL
ncbi:MAG: Uma2 family endonuclease [Chloroflexota bacterium]|nr:Uma2 family endonuclease [Chloroflexota bacterium]